MLLMWLQIEHLINKLKAIYREMLLDKKYSCIKIPLEQVLSQCFMTFLSHGTLPNKTVLKSIFMKLYSNENLVSIWSSGTVVGKQQYSALRLTKVQTEGEQRHEVHVGHVSNRRKGEERGGAHCMKEVPQHSHL